MVPLYIQVFNKTGVFGILSWTWQKQIVAHDDKWTLALGTGLKEDMDCRIS